MKIKDDLQRIVNRDLSESNISNSLSAIDKGIQQMVEIKDILQGFEGYEEENVTTIKSMNGIVKDMFNLWVYTDH